MPFNCPRCKRQNSLNFTSSIELPPDSRSDEITLHLARCPECSFIGLLVYEESRRGSLDSESYYFQGWQVDRETYREVKAQIKTCPEPSNPRCSCQAHHWLGRRDQNGRWVGPPLPPDCRAFEVS